MISAAVLGMLMASASWGQEIQYQLTFEGNWTGNLPRPFSAHFSPLIGMTHEEGASLWAPGQLASQGVENVAELGNNVAITNEINGLINDGTGGELISIPGNIGPVQVVTTNFNVSGDHPIVSILTMIAPSPDWFVGTNVDLRRTTGGWKSSVVLDLNSYDAGTEEGTNLSLNNPPTNPQEPIGLLDVVEPNNVLFGAGSIAQITFTRLTPISVEVAPDSVNVTRGVLSGGSLSDLLDSDNADYSVRRNTADLQSQVIVELTGTSQSETPTDLEFTYEGAVFARSAVEQSIDFWNYDSEEWEEIDSRNAARFTDSVTSVSGSGDLARFVDSDSLELKARIRLQGVNRRPLFTANMDQAKWTVTD